VRLTLYPGCSLHGTAREYGESMYAVLEALGVETQTVPDWCCCGSSPAHLTSHELALALPARNLALAETVGSEVSAPCAACYNRLARANLALQDSALREEINELTGLQYGGGVAVKSLLESLTTDYGLDRIASQASVSLEGLRVVSYYGCLLVRPQEELGGEDAEDPTSMDRLVAELGAEAIDWPFKTECCGGYYSLTRKDIVIQLADKLLSLAHSLGADVIVTACPLCQGNLDMRQGEAKALFDRDYHIPILYFTQLIGLALGLSPRCLGLGRHLVDPRPLLRDKIPTGGGAA